MTTRQRTILSCLGIIVLLILCSGFLIVYVDIVRHEPTPAPTLTIPMSTPTPDRGSEYAATVECRDAIRGQLLIPKSAKFDSLLEPPKVTYQDDLWCILGQVEAQNAYGVMIPNGYYCEVRYQNGRYFVEVADLF